MNNGHWINGLHSKSIGPLSGTHRRTHTTINVKLKWWRNTRHPSLHLISRTCPGIPTCTVPWPNLARKKSNWNDDTSVSSERWRVLNSLIVAAISDIGNLAWKCVSKQRTISTSIQCLPKAQLWTMRFQSVEKQWNKIVYTNKEEWYFFTKEETINMFSSWKTKATVISFKLYEWQATMLAGM